MNPDSATLDHQLLSLLQAVRENHDQSSRAQLNELLRSDPTARATMARLLVDEQALINRLRDDRIVSLLEPTSSTSPQNVARTPRWLTWRPLTAAAAGIVLGMFCTSVVYGFVAQRSLEKKIPLTVYSPGLETVGTSVDDGLPKAIGVWGADSALVVPAEHGVQPPEGKQMMRLMPIPLERSVKNRFSRVYQVLDLRSQPIPRNITDAEVQVTASFCATDSAVASRYLIRAVALDEEPEQATRGFWPKTEEDGVVSVVQRFETSPGDKGWHTFSLKMPLPRGAKSLVFLFGAGSVGEATTEPSPHYLDDVHVSVITSEPTLP
jgi:hypothetical protein